MVRISARTGIDGSPDGWTIEDSVALAAELAVAGVDIVDCSSGGRSDGFAIKPGPNYQVPFAARVREETSLPVAAVD